MSRKIVRRSGSAQIAAGVLGYILGAYFIDVTYRRGSTAARARAYAAARGLPLLNVGAGMELSGADCMAKGNSACYRPHLIGDVNVDITGRKDVAHGTPGVVTFADAQALPFEDGQFGAVFSSHMLEHVEDPAAARRELLRVVGGDPNAVFVITPSWWAPHVAFLPAGHRWYFTDGAGGTRGGRDIRLRR